MNDAISYMVEQLKQNQNIKKIILFGSYARGTASITSDIDLCVIASTTNKRELLTEMYYSLVDADIPVDLLLYTPTEWNDCIQNKFSFAYHIHNEGINLYEKSL